MSKNKTQPNRTEVSELLAGVASDQQRQDCQTLIDLMQRITGEPARVWGSTMIGFGQYHYQYDSGHSGDFFKVGFAPRKGKLSIHILPNLDEFQHYLEQLGKFKTGRSCLYVNKLSDIDASVLESLVAESVKTVEALYP